MALTPKKRRFIDALREGASNKDAAILAGCPEKSAAAAGSRLAKDPDVMAELHKLNALHPVKAGVKGGVKADAASIESEAPSDASDDADDSGFDLAKALYHSDPKAYLLAAMNDAGNEPKLRIDAAKALMPFMHQRKGETGKKEEKDEAAKRVGKGRFGQGRPPLSVVGK